MKIAFTDIETTGLDPRRNEIIAIGCVVFDSDTFQINEMFDIKVRPLFPQLGSPEAYKVNGYTEKGWKDAKSLQQAIKEYARIIEGCLFMAHNPVFDYGFLEVAASRFGMRLPIGRHKLDLMSIAWAKINHVRMPKWSLMHICMELGIAPEPEVHEALNGALKGYECYKKLMS